MSRRVRFITPGRRVAGRDYWLGVANGVLFTLAEAISDANLVLTLFIRELGAPLVLVGLLPALKNGGWLLPQLVAAGRLQARRYVLPVYRQASLIRVLIWALLCLTIFFARELGTALALWIFLLLYAGYNVTGGTSGLAFQVVVAKVIPARRRGSFFGYRLLIGGLLAFFVASPLLRALIGQDSRFSFPTNYGILTSLTLLCIAGGLWSFALVREPPAESVAERQGAGAMLRQVPVLLRQDLLYRRFILVRLLGRLGSIADPFYIIYAVEVLQVPARMVGIYLALRTICAALSNLYWSRIADRHGSQRLLLLTSAMAVLTPITALLLPLLLGLLDGGSSLMAWGFGLIFVLIGLTVDGSATAGMTYLMEQAPPALRPSYMGVSNTLLGVATFFPVLGGLIVENLGYAGLFGMAVLATGAAWRVAASLPGLARARRAGTQAAQSQEQGADEAGER